MPVSAVDLSSTVPTGLPAVGGVRWGTHLCHFYRSEAELREPLVAFIRAGLENRERCLWVASAPLKAAQARAALARIIPDLAAYEQRGQLTIVDFEDWYTSEGSMERDAVLQLWMDAEQEALERGFRGLRLTGNTSWLDESAWHDFADYEAAVHEAFHERRILALCSYTLEQCDADDVLDVLRNHEFALVCTRGDWEVVRSATHLLAAINASRPAPGAEHVARFFGANSYPADAIAQFLAQAPNATAIASTAHLRAIGEALDRLGSRRGVRMIDADQLLQKAERDGVVDVPALQRAVTAIAQQSAPNAGAVHIYGELVDLLSKRGEKQAALLLERTWNELLATHNLSLWCGYDIDHFDEGDAHACSSICHSHGELHMDVPARDQSTFAHALVAELAKHQQYEIERFRYLQSERRLNQRLVSLQQITSALSEAVSLEDVARLVCDALISSLGASHAFLLARSEGAALDVLGSVGLPEALFQVRDGSGDHARLPWHEAFESGNVVWIADSTGVSDLHPLLARHMRSLVCFPMVMHHHCLGVIGFGFTDEHSFDSDDRALYQDVCNQVSMALERARLYEEARRQRERAESAGYAKDQFIAMLGHELRNPLAALQTAAELLAVSGGKPDVLERTRSIVARQTSHMAKLIDDLLDVSRIIWSKVELHRSPIDLTQLVDDVLKDQAGAIEHRGIELQWKPGDQSIWVNGDRVRLVQIFDNLLTNAVKFSSPGGRIRIDLHDESGSAVLKVRDNGAGIDPNLLDRIFEPFQQANQDLARTAGGLGLGLTLVKGLVDLHQGSIQVHSDGPGTGCEVTVRIPAVAGSGQLPEAAVAGGSACRILIVEDNRDAADALAQLLRFDGHHVSVAYDGEQALAMVAECEPQWVLCDVGLPGRLSGYDVAQALRTLPACADTRLIAFTGYGTADDIARARASGFEQHLTKPVAFDTLRKLLAVP